ncbi:DUF397 domain-containing protein [Amycolatopsis palatopharyngis]|uniref:DUF397 domain-containing protein n=1 Tax=Amycolatopsis palatopharyngis TaxID=187982 RepID=UPI000E2376AD|nr:DUF397 domain-containing protein [Amycolatopsis palatopharyngis]
MTIPRDPDTWRKSSYSSTETNCVEVAYSHSAMVRDTKDRTGGSLALTSAAWRSFTASVKRA